MASPAHFHASPTPIPSAEIRSQAIAKLKRAASLPRTPDGRRPPPTGQLRSGGASTNPSTATSEESHAPSANAATPSPSRLMNDYGHEELLSAGPSMFGGASVMQRSTSDSSSFHIPTPPHVYGSSNVSPYFTAQPSPVGAPGTDWAAYQLAQSYLPSISPVTAPPSSFPQSLQTPTGPGRNTPSPLPSLGELRTLSRSNSAMARAKAMMALTGQANPDTPTRSTNLPTPTSSDEDITLGIPGSRLTRAGTIGVPRMFGMPADEPAVDTTTSVAPAVAPMADTTLDVPRPRLQRSFTVSSSNMGEERRSAVGRRMVERLAERRAARQQEEVEVRHLWEERRKTRPPDADGKQPTQPAEDDEEEDPSPIPVPNLATLTLMVPSVDATSASAPTTGIPTTVPSLGPSLAASSADRTPSRNTERSDEAFEYESHLRRSLSSRTAREVIEPSPEVAMPSPLIEDAAEGVHGSVFQRQQQPSFTQPSLVGQTAPQLSFGQSSPFGDSSFGDSFESFEQRPSQDRTSFERPSSEQSSFEQRPSLELQDDEQLLRPVQPFANAHMRHVPHDSTSSAGTVMPPAAGNSPSSESTATLDSAGLFYRRSPSKTAEPPIEEDERLSSWDDDHNVDWVTGPRSQGHHDYSDTYHYQETVSAVSHVGHSGHGADTESLGHMRTSHDIHDRSSSRMSWEEIGSVDEHEAQADQHQGKTSGSFSRKNGRGMLNAMRKYSRSGSITSQVTSPPASPNTGFASAFARRESESSTSTGQRSATVAAPRESPTVSKGVKHQASNGSITPSFTTTGPADTVASANNLLIQHQLAHAPSPISFLPRPDMSDPRIHNSKLSPFPGITTLEQKQRSRSGSDSREQPRLVQQLSDPTVPTNRAAPVSASSDRESADAANGSTRRHWFGKGSISRGSGSGSGGRSQQSSQHSQSTSEDYRNGSMRRLATESPVDEMDPLSTARGRLSPETAKNSKNRPEIPQYMFNRRRAPPPPIELGSSNVESINGDAAPKQLGNSVAGLGDRSTEVLNRMDAVLGLSAQDPSRHDFLDDPPRKLLLSQQVLQVVNVNTVKDRYLFLFNDILVIAKPVITVGTQATLDMKFIVKSVVGLDKLVVSGLSDEPTAEPPRHPAVTQFIQDFGEDAPTAVQQLIERSALKIDSVTLSSLLFKTVELDKSQIGQLLAHDSQLLEAFVDRFQFSQVRIDDALRMFLLAIRLPTNLADAEPILRGFAHIYCDANKGNVEFDGDLAGELVISMLELNDMLYSTFGFAFPNHAISRDAYVNGYYAKDPDGLVPDDLLDEIYVSIRYAKLVQGLAPSEAHLARDITVTPSRLPSRITYNEWSERIVVAIPRPDPAFKVEFVGEGLQFDPPFLDFTDSHEVSFRTRGVSLGPKTMLFHRTGNNAALYAGIGNGRSFNVERAFMRHTFYVQFVSHLGNRRKYCFSVPDAAARQRWGQMLTRQVWLTTEKKQGAGAPTTHAQRVRRAAEAVSLQVLRDALIPPDENPETAGGGARKLSHTAAQRDPHRAARVASVSLAYAAKAGGDEAALGPLIATKGNNPDATGMVNLQTGKELVLLCRQNSLLPGVLELLQSGTGAQATATAPTSAPGSATAPASAIPHASHLQPSGVQPQRSAGLKAMMQDRRL